MLSNRLFKEILGEEARKLTFKNIPMFISNLSETVLFDVCHFLLWLVSLFQKKYTVRHSLRL